MGFKTGAFSVVNANLLRSRYKLQYSDSVAAVNVGL